MLPLVLSLRVMIKAVPAEGLMPNFMVFLYRYIELYYLRVLSVVSSMLRSRE